MGFKSLLAGELISNALVVDNSVMMRWLFEDGADKDQRYAQNVLAYIEVNNPQVIAPYFWVYEASFVVNYYVKKGVISTETGTAHLEALFDLCTVIRGEETPGALFGFSKTHGLSSYDAAYTMLAMQQTCPIATLDKEIITASDVVGLAVFG